VNEREAIERKFTFLDYIEDIKVDGEPFIEPANEYAALLALKEGMNFLYRFAADCDKTILARLDPSKKFFMTGNCPEFVGIPMHLLTCSFHWYSISACQYVKTVGAIAYRQNNDRPLPPKYTESVIPEVLTFRDKVAAHFAWNTLHGQDNEAERLASIMPPVGFYDDSFHVGVMTVTMGGGGQSTNSSAISPWSITKTHQRLQKRYWPEEIQGPARG
jgi:hypothetical protein